MRNVVLLCIPFILAGLVRGSLKDRKSHILVFYKIFNIYALFSHLWTKTFFGLLPWPFFL